jgi:hypothetical protein
MLARLIAAYRVRSSSVAVGVLIFINLLPILGVLYLGWSLILILGLYWLENGVIGVLNVPKILLAQGTAPTTIQMSVNGRPVNQLSRTGLAGFFLIHYGIFWVVHGLFVFAFVPTIVAGPFVVGSGITNLPATDLPIGAFIFGGTVMAISHLTSFIVNYLGRAEYRSWSPAQLMTEPYRRLVILHMTIIGGAFISAYLGVPIGSLIVLVLLKTVMDLYFHLREHAPESVATIPAT